MQSRGNTKQEQKIDTLADIVVAACPDLSKLSVKGSFRFGITEALKVTGFGKWEEVATQSAAGKQRFFDSLLDNAMAHMVRMGFPTDQQDIVRKRLVEENQRFLKQ